MASKGKKKFLYNESMSNLEGKIPKMWSDRLELLKSILEVTEGSIQTVFEEIKKSGTNINYLIRYISYLTVIRPFKTKIYFDLYDLLKTHFTFTFPVADQGYDASDVQEDDYDDLISFTRNPLILYSMLDGNSAQKAIKKEELIEIFKPNSIEYAIKNDDVITFVNFISKPNFDPLKKVINNDKRVMYTMGTNKVNYLQLAALFGATKIFRACIIHEIFDEKDVTQYAVAGGNSEIIRILEQKNNSFNKVYNTAVKFHQEKISYWLLKNFQCEEFELFWPLKYFNQKAFFFCIVNKLDVSKNSINRALYWAAGNNDVEMIDYLVTTMHANVESKITGFPTIQNASSCDCVDAIRALATKYHANIEAENDFNITPLCSACFHGALNSTKCLIEEFHANTKARSAFGFSILVLAAQEGYLDVVKYLTEECHINVNDEEGCQDALSIAAQNGHLSTVKYLMEKWHMNPFTYDDDGYMAFISVINREHLDILKYFVEEQHMSFLDLRNESNPLKQAIATKNKEIIDYVTPRVMKELKERGYGIEFLKILELFEKKRFANDDDDDDEFGMDGPDGFYMDDEFDDMDEEEDMDDDDDFMDCQRSNSFAFADIHKRGRQHENDPNESDIFRRIRELENKRTRMMEDELVRRVTELENDTIRIREEEKKEETNKNINNDIFNSDDFDIEEEQFEISENNEEEEIPVD